jgi:aminoglycoside phosphotransferase (APT) family kinase protein
VSPSQPDDLAAALERFLAARMGGEPRIQDLRRLPGGASRETWAFDLECPDGGEPVRLELILRREPRGSTLESNVAQEFRLHSAAHAADVPVPRPRWFGSDPEGLGDFYVMDRVAGETLARRLLRDDEYAPARRAMTAELGAILARIHRIDPAAGDLAFLQRPGPGESPARAELDRYEQLYRAIALEPHPAFELAFRWLRERLPARVEATLVHGDYRIGNVIFGPEGVRAILDWELAHVGDPMEDLGWLCVRAWRFGRDEKPVGGIGERGELFDAYEGAGGGPVDPERVRFWEVFGNLKWATICIVQTRRHIDGQVRSVELAALGRRTAETELELLELISGGG